MKNIKYIKQLLFAIVVCTAAVSCMDDDWSSNISDEPQFGNNDLQETNVISIADLKSRYFGNTWNAYDTIRIKDDVQIKGIVTANDIEGNVYNEVSVEDETGGILVCISQGGLFGYLAVGQEILIDLKDLYIGHYGSQPQIGTPYTNTSGRTFPSRMNRTLWQTKFKLIGKADPSRVQPEEFDVTKMADAEYVKAKCGKVMTVKGVQMAEANGVKVWASEAEKDAGNGVSRTIKVNGKTNSNFVVRSSTYADFAAQIMPQGNINLTGIFTVYSSNPASYGYTWQILLRESSDIEMAE
ncbi:MAG: DUF5689 domain-containing protein [Prevotella sp.]